MNNFSLNQIVAGNVGQFVIVGFHPAGKLGAEAYAQVKAYNPATGKVARGELALPLSVLKEVV